METNNTGLIELSLDLLQTMSKEERDLFFSSINIVGITNSDLRRDVIIIEVGNDFVKPSRDTSKPYYIATIDRKEMTISFDEVIT